MRRDALLRVLYGLRLRRGESAEEKALGIAREQTVELDLALVPKALRTAVAGRVEAVATSGAGSARALVAYDPALVAGDFPQLLNLLFGNVSMQAGVRIERIDWPARLLAHLPRTTARDRGAPRAGGRGDAAAHLRGAQAARPHAARARRARREARARRH